MVKDVTNKSCNRPVKLIFIGLSPSMMICFQFSPISIWIALSTALLLVKEHTDHDFSSKLIHQDIVLCDLLSIFWMVPSESAWPPLSFVIIFKEHNQESSTIVDLSQPKKLVGSKTSLTISSLEEIGKQSDFKTPVACKPDCSSNSAIEKEVAAISMLSPQRTEIVSPDPILRKMSSLVGKASLFFLWL